MRLFAIFCLVLSINPAWASRPCTDEEFSSRKSKGLPPETKAILLRIIQCNHMAGEVGDNDKERTQQIADTVAKLKCSSLDEDRAAVLKRNSNNKAVQTAFSSADSWEGSCDK